MQKLFLFFLTNFLIIAFPAHPQEKLGIQDAIKITLENNYGIKIVSNDYQISRNNQTLGNAGFLPTLDLAANKNWSSENVNLEISGSEGTFNIQRNWAKSNFLSAAADFQWVIFDGLGMFATREKLNEVAQSAKLNQEMVMENTIALVSEVYYKIVLEQAKLGVLQNTIKLSEQRKQIAETKYQIGKASKLEFLAAQVDYNEDQSAVIAQQELLSATKIDLNNILSRGVDTPFDVMDSIQFMSMLNLADLKGSMNTRNPQLMLLSQEKKIAYLEEREAKSDQLPSIYLDVSYGYTNLNREAGQLQSNISDGVTYGVGASWNLFDGFNTRRTVQNARILVNNSELAYEQVKLDLDADLQKVYLSYQSNLNLYELERANLAVAKENEEIALERYKLGNSDALELREAQLNAVAAESRMLDAAYSVKVAEIELYRLSGELMSQID